MCRLFAQISPAPSSAEPYLCDSEFSLLRQSDFKRSNLQKDGWGIACFGNKNEPVVTKNWKPAFEEPKKFRAAAGRRSRVVIGHIRAASNPRGLVKSRLITMQAAQPFTDGRWVFAHNGTLEIPDEVASRLGPLGARLRSLNDSEVYFRQFLKFHGQKGDVAEALRACIEEDWALWEECRRDYPRKKGPYTSLNALISDGRRLYALCHTARPGRPEGGVCNPAQPWSVMSFARRGKQLLVASENLDRGAWKRFDPPELLCAEIESGAVRIKRRRLEIPQTRRTLEAVS